MLDSQELPYRFSTLKDCFEAIVFRDMAKSHGNDHDRLPGGNKQAKTNENE
jgi:hypothetical protein